MIDSTAKRHVVVVGGGIAGLAAAHALANANPALQVTLVEASQRLGGKIVTERVDGFVVEGGPDSFLAAKPRGVGLAVDVGLGDRLQGTLPRPKRAFIVHGGRLHDVPEGLSGLVPTRLAPLARSGLLSPRGKARVALDYVLPPRQMEDEPLGAFIRRRLGRQAWERLVEPLMAGIYAADGDQLSLAATFSQLRQAEQLHGGLIRGVLAARSAASSSGPPKPPFLTPKAGLDSLVGALADTLRQTGVTIRGEVAATTIARVANGYVIGLAHGAPLHADAVIVAIPAFAAADLLSALDASLASELAGIPHASTAIVSLAYRRDEIPHPLAGHGYVIPRAEGTPILACTWSSRKWSGRAPVGWELLRVFIGRAGDRQIDVEHASEEALHSLAQREVAVRLGVSARPALNLVHRWRHGMPQYVVGHPARLARIEARLRAHPGLLLAGNAYHGVGIPDCIASGERAAHAALAHFEPVMDNRGSRSLAPAAMVTPPGQ
jgi:oxygen-dependent protoporphyrinogen oxidase